MKRIFTLLVFAVWGFGLFAQQYGNEWIDYNRTHYKVKVATDGIYRIPYSTLVAAIPAIASINPANLVMFHNGEQVPIYVSNNSTIGQNDYIEFFGRRNRGEVDSLLYSPRSAQPHPYYSLYSDTSVYFLTTSASQSNARFSNVSNDLNNLPPRDNFFIHTVRSVFTNGGFYGGKQYYAGSDEFNKSTYEEGEGWASAWVNNSNSPRLDSLNTPFVYNGVGSPGFATFKMFTVSRTNTLHKLRVEIGGQTMISEDFSGFKQDRFVRQLQLSQLVSGFTKIKSSYIDNSPGSQQNRFQMMEIAYPRTYDFANVTAFRWFMTAGSGKRYIEVANYNSNGMPILYDFVNGIRIELTPGTIIPIALPASNVERELYLTAEGDINNIGRISPISFVNYSLQSRQGDFVIVSHPSLGIDAAGVATGALKDYRDYRDVSTGGKYRATVVDVEQLYDQFAYGISKHPLAIQSFIQYAVNNWPAPRKPAHVLLLGKAREYPEMRSNASAREQCTVPTFGNPGSDILMACPIGSNVPSVAIGRVAAQSVGDITIYLDKLKSYESLQAQYAANQNIPDKEWMKQVLHFSGGSSLSEQTLLRNYVNNWRSIITDTFYGANVTSYNKTTNAPIQIGLQTEIKNKINHGISLLTFFGHSAAGAGFDISIDEPENYVNYDRYPVIISNGCLAGMLHGSVRNYSERFVLPQANKKTGAIAFLATTGLSLSNSLYAFTSQVYSNLAKKTYTGSLGNIVKQSMADLNSCCANQDFTMMTAYEFTLHGDPSVTLNQYAKPDYAIDVSSMYFNPANITAATDTFEVKIINTNLGRAIKDSIKISITRRVRDPQNPSVFLDLNYEKKVPATYYKDTFTFRIPTLVPYNNSYIGYGGNEFGAFVESEEKIDEMAELNNRIALGSVVVSIQSDDIIPIYPYEFAIVPKQGVTLKASTVNPFAPLRTYRFEIDTTENFNSSKKSSGTVTQTGGVVKFTPNITYEDSLVYYWRVGIDSGGTGSRWHYSSFIYLKDEYPGWNQSHYFQYQKDNFDLLNYGTNRQFSFPITINQIDVTAGNARDVNGIQDPLYMRWFYNGILMHAGRFVGCGGFTSGLVFAVIDSSTGKAWSSINTSGTNYGPYGNIHCAGNGAQNGFDFRTANANHPTISGKTWAQVISDFINAIPDGHYVLVYTNCYSNPNYTSWDTVLVNALVNKLGAATFQQLKNGSINQPYIYFTEKGNPNYSSTSVLGTGGISSSVSTSISLNGRWHEGFMTSTIIGPAMEWGSFHWRKNALENPSTDGDTVNIYGIDNANQKVLLLSTTQPDNFIQNINAQQYPYLQLQLKTHDNINRTPTQLYYWRVLYKEVPEAALNPSVFFKATDSVLLGGNYTFEMAVENVTDIHMDSLLTKYILRDAALSQYTYYIKQDSLRGLDTMILKLSVPINGNNYQGTNRVYIETNPLDNNHQLEQYHFNNIAEVSFTTSGDNVNPLLDVTFDGKHIVSGELVSAKPNIVITLKDENKFLALNDTSLMDIYIKYPNEAKPRKLVYDNNILTFYPANVNNLSKDNTAKVELKPVFTVDGRYELMISDRDRSGNQSSSTPTRYEGDVYYDYKTSFEIVTKTSITNILNYPNPFTTSTKFVFTLTGSGIPDQMSIQIMTIRGIVVKQITQAELGPIRIGDNITEYAWDGRDQYGDLLANGVYFYRVVTKMNGEVVDHRSESFDKYFKKGFGKMVMVR